MYKMLQDVILYGTGRAAQVLGRSDIAGKTGTTNNQKDAWFVGFNTKLVTAVYIGFDRPKSMGPLGYGGKVALPAWIEYMKVALKGVPIQSPKQPKNVINNNGFYSISGKPVIGKVSNQLSNSSNKTDGTENILDNLF